MLDKIKILLGISDDESEYILQIMIDDAKSAVCDYCNRKDFPSGLEYLVRELVIESFKLNNEGNISSIKRGDTQITYSESITKANFTQKQQDAMYKYKMVKII